jgi:DNA-binding GntR family transcriptional regulator
MPPSAPGTRSDWVEERLRTAILDGELVPGQRLQADRLAQRWDVSPTPLREAFQRLASDGLVEMPPQRGARVAALSVRDATEIYELRLILEPLCLRRSLECSDDEHRQQIREAFEFFRSASTLSASVGAHAQFHRVLLERCPSGWLRRFAAQLADASRLYQVASTTGRPARRHPKAEHRALRDAAVAGDIDGCVALQEAHLRRTLDLIAGDP